MKDIFKVENFIEPHFQPIVGTRDHIPYAYEALLRLKGSDDLPQALFRQWESSGYVTVIDRAMVRYIAAALGSF